MFVCGFVFFKSNSEKQHWNQTGILHSLSYLIPGFVVLGGLVIQQIIPLARSGAVWRINFKDLSNTFFFLALWGLNGEQSGVSGPWGRGVSALKHVSTPPNIS